jgi:amidase
MSPETSTETLTATIRELNELYERKITTPLEVREQFFSHADAVDPSLNALSARFLESSLREAWDSQERHEEGRSLGALDGMPISVKDSIDVAGQASPMGLLAFKNRPPAAENALLVDRLREAGAVIVAQTTAPDMNMGITGVSSLYGITRNPWDLSAGPGGSSAGAAASLAAGLGVGSIGSDLAGSVRIPAARCGLASLKPTQGRIAHLPVNPIRSTGAMARTVEDVALIHQAIALPHPYDTNSLPAEPRSWSGPLSTVEGLRIGVLADLGSGAAPEPDVIDVVQQVAEWLSAAGAEVIHIPPVFETDPLPALDRTFRVRAHHDIQALPESSRSEVLGHLRMWAEEAARYPAVDYYADQAHVNASQMALARSISPFDAVITPVVPTTRVEAEDPARDPQQPWLDSGLVAWFNQTGHPAAVVCGGFSKGLPVGVQVIGQRFEDLRVLELAAWIESHRPFHITWPTFPSP